MKLFDGVTGTAKDIETSALFKSFKSFKSFKRFKSFCWKKGKKKPVLSELEISGEIIFHDGEVVRCWTVTQKVMSSMPGGVYFRGPRVQILSGYFFYF